MDSFTSNTVSSCQNGWLRPFLTSKLTDDCMYVYDAKDDEQQQNVMRKFVNGGKRVNKAKHTIITFICAGCRAIYDRGGIMYKQIPKAQLNQTTNVWSSDPHNIPATSHFCQPVSINEERSNQIRNNVKRAIVRTGAPAAKVMRKATIDAMEKYGSRDDITEDDLREIIGPLSHNKASQMQMYRAKKKAFPKIDSFDQLNTHANLQKYKFTIRGASVNEGHDRFQELFYRGSGTNFDLFASDVELEILAQSTHIFLDGNFRFSPSGSHQVYRIFALVDKTYCLPVVTAVMKRRRKRDYQELFGRVRDLLTEKNAVLAIEFAHMDYEKAAASSFKRIFPDIQVKVCVFHAKQALLRWMRSNGLDRAIKEKNQIVVHLLQMLSSLQHVPQTCYDQMRASILGWLEARFDDNNDEYSSELRQRDMRALRETVDYYYRTWIYGSMGPEFFCLFDLQSNRTNNYAEAFHSTLQSHFEKKCKPGLSEWLMVTREINAVMVFRAECILSGSQVAPSQSTQSMEMDEKAKNAKSKFEKYLDSGDVRRMMKVLRRFAKLHGLSAAELDQVFENIEVSENQESNENEVDIYL